MLDACEGVSWLSKRRFAGVWAALAVALASASSLIVGLAVNAVPKSWGWAHDWWLLSGLSATLLVVSAVVAIVQARSSSGDEGASGPPIEAEESQHGIVAGSNSGMMISARTVIIGSAVTVGSESSTSGIDAESASFVVSQMTSHNYAPQGELELDRADRVRSIRLLIEAKQIAESINEDYSRAAALYDIARLVAPIDHDRATRIIAEAERIAYENPNDMVISEIVGALAVVDPDRAERTVHFISGPTWKARALAYLALGLAATNPDRAERLAEAIINESVQSWTLAGIAEALVTVDPRRAERIVRSISDEEARARALAGLAAVVASIDPESAVWIIADAEGMAEHLGKRKKGVLVDIAIALATIDPNRAECMARSMDSDDSQVAALSGIAGILASKDAESANRLIAEASGLVPCIESYLQDSALDHIAEALTIIDPDRAERMIQEITEDDPWNLRLVKFVRVLAATDPDRAERVARSIARTRGRMEALIAIVEAINDRAKGKLGDIKAYLYFDDGS
jgi:hypothetical protein